MKRLAHAVTEPRSKLLEKRLAQAIRESGISYAKLFEAGLVHGEKTAGSAHSVGGRRLL